MTEKLVTPKFLTASMAETAVRAALDFIFEGKRDGMVIPHRKHLHIVVLVPGMADDREADYPDWPNYPLKPVALYEESRGDPKEFEYAYIEIARCKALQLWTDRNDDRTDIIPHLLFPGDTPYWGGVKRHGIVVACSGLKPWLDKLVSGMIADLLVCMAHEAWLESPDYKNEVEFLA